MTSLATKREFVWKIGVLNYGGSMFIMFSLVGPLIPHFTMGKPLTVGAYLTGAITSAIVCFPAGALFGWLMWNWSMWKTRRANK